MQLLLYYLDERNEQHGPYNSRQVASLWHSREIGPNTLVRTDRMNEWVPITTLEDYVPGFYVEGDPSSIQPKRIQHWGYRVFKHCLKNAFLYLIGLAMAIGILRQIYTDLALDWIFPANKLPTPAMEIKEGFDPDNYRSSENLPQVYHGEVTARPPMITLVQNPGRERFRPSSLEGQINRALLGQPKCIKPSKIVPLPANLPFGRFYLQAYDHEIFFAADNEEADLTGFTQHETDYDLGGLKLRQYAQEFEVEHIIPRIGSYSQCSKRLTSFVCNMEGMLVSGSQSDWSEFGHKMTERGNFELFTNVRLQERHRLGSKTAIASCGDYPNRKIAIDDFYPGNVEDPLQKTRRLRILSNGKVLQQRSVSFASATQGITKVAERRTAVAEASPYLTLVFSEDGRYLAGLRVDGKVQVLTSSLKLIATLNVDMAGPYIRSGKNKGKRVLGLSTPRLSFDPQANYLIGTDAGNVFVFDLRTEQLTTTRFPGKIDTCTFLHAQVIAASPETGELYLASLEQLAKGKLQLSAKALVAGLGPLISAVNFSSDGESLSAIFDESEFGAPRGELSLQPWAKYALFWDLRFIRDPTTFPRNESTWYCTPDFRDRYPGHRGGFFSLAMKKRENLLTVMTYDREQKQMHETPLRVLSPEAQLEAIKMHSLVETANDRYHFNPRTQLSYNYPSDAEVVVREDPFGS